MSDAFDDDFLRMIQGELDDESSEGRAAAARAGFSRERVRDLIRARQRLEEIGVSERLLRDAAVATDDPASDRLGHDLAALFAQGEKSTSPTPARRWRRAWIGVAAALLILLPVLLPIDRDDDLPLVPMGDEVKLIEPETAERWSFDVKELRNGDRLHLILEVEGPDAVRTEVLDTWREGTVFEVDPPVQELLRGTVHWRAEVERRDGQTGPRAQGQVRLPE